MKKTKVFHVANKVVYVVLSIFSVDSNIFLTLGYALTVQQGFSALRILNCESEVLSEGVTSLEHVSYDKDGNTLGVYGPCNSIKSSSDSKLLNSSSDDSSQSESEIASGDINSLGSSNKRRRHNVHIPRQVLRQIMMEKVDPKFVKWGYELSDCRFDKNRNRPIMIFKNGAVDEADVIVAADGINSTVRKLLVPGIKLQYLGLLVVLGISKNTDSLGPSETGTYRKAQWVDGTTRVFTMPYDRDHIMWQVSFTAFD